MGQAQRGARSARDKGLALCCGARMPLETGLLCLAALAARHSSITSRKVSICTITFLFAYPIFGWISYKAWGQYSGERETMLLQTLPIMLLGLALYLTGAAARSHRIYRTIWMTWLLMACYVLLNA